MKELTTPSAIRSAVLEQRNEGDTVGFVPTMGALHDGHRRLIHKSLKENDRTAVSIFVNPEQFDTDRDAEVYPRSIEDDRDTLEEDGVDWLFHPSYETMYPEGDVTEVSVDLPLTGRYEGKIRPRFFDGVARIVTKLLNAVPSDRVYFGEKDLQQLMMIRRMVTDLHFEHTVRPVAVARDEDGVAYSSRNRKFTVDDWEVARSTYDIMEEFRRGIESRDRGDLDDYRDKLEEAGLKVQYVDVVDYTSFQPVQPDHRRAVLIVAGYAGEVRLKDHLVLHAENLVALENVLLEDEEATSGGG